MAVGDWDIVKNTGVMTIENEAGDHVWQIDVERANGAEQGYELYNGKTDFKDSEIKALVKIIDPYFNIYGCAFVFRSDVGLSNAYLVFLEQSITGPNWEIIPRLYKMTADVLTLMHTGAKFNLATNTWYKWRVRCWDLMFPPATTVRFTLELETAPGFWTVKYSYDELTGYRFGISGRSGFGGRNTAAGAAPHRIRFNDIALGHYA